MDPRTTVTRSFKKCPSLPFCRMSPWLCTDRRWHTVLGWDDVRYGVKKESEDVLHTIPALTRPHKNAPLLPIPQSLIGTPKHAIYTWVLHNPIMPGLGTTKKEPRISKHHICPVPLTLLHPPPRAICPLKKQQFHSTVNPDFHTAWFIFDSYLTSFSYSHLPWAVNLGVFAENAKHMWVQEGSWNFPPHVHICFLSVCWLHTRLNFKINELGSSD